jgi:methylamine dehydrogenase accessory protein MauD
MMWGVISAQWVALGVLALLVVGLMREVGLMQLKIGPPGAMGDAQGAPIGITVERQLVATFDDTPVTLPQPDSANMIVFLSPSCGVCHQLIDPVRTVAKHERDLAVTVVCGGDERECTDFLGDMGKRVLVVPDYESRIKESLGITSSSFAQVFDRDGVAGPSGIVNNLAHLESLLKSFDEDGRLVLEGVPPVPTNGQAAMAAKER